MDKKASEYIAIYKEQLAKGEIQAAYNILLKYIMHLKTYCKKTFPENYSFGNISSGRMDFTYFPFFDDYLRKEKLRFGIMLNHCEMRFELWLMGQNAEIQTRYWNLLKQSPWNQHRIDMPKYSVIEMVLVETPDFDNVAALTAEISTKALCFSEEIIGHLKTLRR